MPAATLLWFVLGWLKDWQMDGQEGQQGHRIGLQTDAHAQQALTCT